MAYLVEIFLPVTDDRGSRSNIDAVRDELTEKFGGVTLHLSSPAEGLWEDDGAVERDRIIVVEAMTNDLDRAWWSEYRNQLQTRFHQNEIVIRATAIERL